MRERAIEEFVREPLHLLVIGGGIVGAGVARDAALRGLRVGLIDRYDFAFGTSSRTSRLLHGGLRYLAQGRLGLVREASVEKRILHQIAPHLCHPLAFVFPSYRGTRWQHGKLHLGVRVYDLLCGGRNLGRSESLSRDAALRHVSGLRADGLTGAVRYYDGLTNDARLVIDTLRSASNAGALVENYVQFTGAELAPAGWQCALTDRLTGSSRTLFANCVVNATGPWTETVPHSSIKLRLTKGIHIVVDRTRLPVPDAVVMTEGPRILFVIPWSERVIIGTTDHDYAGPIDMPCSEPHEIEYLLRIANEFFPCANLTQTDVISTWAGLRPLIADPSGRPFDISRSHEIRNSSPGWWDVAGGKLTTYRLMAEQTVDRVVRVLKGLRAITNPGPCRTADEPLLPRGQIDGVSGIAPPAFERRAIEHYCRCEWAVHLQDVMVRRTGWHYYCPDAKTKAEEAAAWMGELRGWTPQQTREELHDYSRAYLSIS